MECNKVREKLSCYMDAALDEGRLEAVEAHLSTCAECHEELEALRSVISLTSDLSEVDPPADLARVIKDAIARDRARPSACETWAPMLSVYSDGELSDEDAAGLELHLAACEACSADLAMLRSTVAAMDLVSEVAPPAGLRTRIAAATTGRRASPFVLVTERLSRLSLAPKLGLAAGAAAAAAVVAVWLALPSEVAQKPTVVITPVRPPVAAALPGERPEARSTTELTSPLLLKPSRPITLAYKPMGGSIVSTGRTAVLKARQPVATEDRSAPAVPPPSTEEASSPPATVAELGVTLTDAAAKGTASVTDADAAALKPTTLVGYAAKPVVRGEEIDRFFKDVKLVAQMMQSDQNTITVDVASRKF